MADNLKAAAMEQLKALYRKQDNAVNLSNELNKVAESAHPATKPYLKRLAENSNASEASPVANPYPAGTQFKMVPITELTHEQIQRYAPEIDLNAAGSAFAKVRVPVEPPKAAPAPAPRAAPKRAATHDEMLNDMYKLLEEAKKLNPKPDSLDSVKKVLK